MLRHALRIAIVGLTSSALLMGGCSAFQPGKQSVTISTATPGAAIQVDGASVGVTPVTVQLERNKEHAIIARQGGRTGTYNLGTKISTTGVLDIVGTVLFIVPVIGILTPGFKELDSTNVIVPLGLGNVEPSPYA